MSRFEMHVTTSVEGEQGGVVAMDDMIMCFVEDEMDREEVEATAKYVLAQHCKEASEDFEILYCTANIYIRDKAELSLSFIRKDIAPNVVPMHAPDRENMN